MSDAFTLEQLRGTAVGFREAGDVGTAYLLETTADRLASLGEALADARRSVVGPLEKGIVERIDATLAGSAACPLPNIRILHRGAPDSVVIRFARDITNEEVEAVGKAWVAAQRAPRAPVTCQFCGKALTAGKYPGTFVMSNPAPDAAAAPDMNSAVTTVSSSRADCNCPGYFASCSDESCPRQVRHEK